MRPRGRTIRERVPGLACGFAAVFAPLAAHAAPPPETTVSEWAEQYRYVGEESGSPEPGPWKNERAPYLVEPMDACQVDNGIRRVILTGSAQFGKSEIPLNALAHTIDTAPRPLFVVLPSIDEARAWSRLKWEPNVEKSPRWRANVLLRKSRSDEGSTSAVKRYRGGQLEIVTAGSSKALQMRTIAYIVFEEVTQYADQVGEGGDPIAAAENRMTTYGLDAKAVLCSTPGFVGQCRITQEYNTSDMRRWFTPCPHCGDFIVLDFGTFQLSSEGRPIFHCGGCGVEIEESHKRAMNAAGRWVPTFEHPEFREDDPDEPNPARAANPAPPAIIPAADIERWQARDCEGRARGYHLWQGQSNFASWLVIWETWQKVQRGESDETEFYQKVLGLPYEPKVERPDFERLYEARGKIYRTSGVIPEWACIVTGAIDVQINRVEWAVYAWGRGGIGARVATGVIAKNPLNWSTWKEDVANLVETRFAGPSYKARLADFWCVDSGGNATENVYNFCYPRQYSTTPVYAIKGSSHDKGDALPFAKGNRVRVWNNGRPIGKMQLWFIGTYNLKARVYHGLTQGLVSLEQKQLQPRAIVFPPNATKEEFKQITAEHFHQPDPRKRGVWDRPAGQANEQLDMAVYCLALAWSTGMDTWDEFQWAKRAAERAPDPKAAAMLPLEQLMQAGPEPEDAEAVAVDLTPPPAEGARRSMSEADRERLREIARKNRGG